MSLDDDASQNLWARLGTNERLTNQDPDVSNSNLCLQPGAPGPTCVIGSPIILLCSVTNLGYQILTPNDVM